MSQTAELSKLAAEYVPHYRQDDQSSRSESSEYDDDPEEITVDTRIKTNKNSQKQRSEYSQLFSVKPEHNTFTKYDSKISLQQIANEASACEIKFLTKQKKDKDKADRATVEQVLDERTRVILRKLLKNELVTEINGCLSTGKEANVYHAVHEVTKKEYAIKIYKTSILVFKDRDRYVEGEFRFRRGYCSSNPRKMVKMWAQKQFRNLKRIQGNIPCPSPALVKSNVLVMDFMGKDMKAAHKLKDYPFQTQEQTNSAYLQVVEYLRILYHKCRLIHADLSEYNLLYYEGRVVMIDVSQSVEHDHPMAIDFLRRDIGIINQFFKKRGIKTFSDWNVFRFTVGSGIMEGKEQEFLLRMVAEASKMGIQPEGDSLEDRVFQTISLPMDLSAIPIEKVEKELFGGSKANIGAKYDEIMSGLVKQTLPQVQEGQDSSSVSSSDEEDGKSSISKDEKGLEGSEALEPRSKKSRENRYEGMSKLERKQQIKEENREKRKEKMPKKVKDKLTKKH